MFYREMSYEDVCYDSCSKWLYCMRCMHGEVRLLFQKLSAESFSWPGRWTAFHSEKI